MPLNSSSGVLTDDSGVLLRVESILSNLTSTAVPLLTFATVPNTSYSVEF